jgi:hypothetical protein
VTGIRFDAGWVGGYAELTANSADALAEGVTTMGTAPLDQESFGELGRVTGSAQAYGKASQVLRDQLARSVEALGSASEGLAEITAAYVDSEDQGALAITKELR